MRKDLRDQKKQIVAQNLPLTPDEATRFWPVYDQYTAETIKVNDQRYALIKEYGAAGNNMTDEQASSYIKTLDRSRRRSNATAAEVHSNV